MEREQQVELKLQVDGRKNRVLFAECGGDFVDLLFALLTIPLSTIIRLTTNRPKLGSISKLYESLAKLDGGYFRSANTQAMLLSGYSKPDDDDGEDDDRDDYEVYDSKEDDDEAWGMRWVSTVETAKTEGGKRNVFVGEGLRFVVTDDLRVMPLSIRSTFSRLRELGVEDCSSFRSELVTVGVEELLNLLRHSFVSKRPLTDAFLQHPSVVLDPLPGFKLVGKARPLEDTTLSYVKMDVNVELMVYFDKSSDTTLYAEAGEDFVDLLFSFMTFPLGCVVKLLDGNSDVGCIDNLTNSIEVLEKEKYMKDGVGVRNMIHLKHYIGFCLQDLALPLAEKLQIPLYARDRNYRYPTFESEEIDIMRNKKFMRGPAKFMIMNNLEIVPTSPTAGLSVLKEQRVSLNDVQDRVLQIGQEEALTLLKASLKSESALNDFFQLYVGQKHFTNGDLAQGIATTYTRSTNPRPGPGQYIDVFTIL